MEAAILHCDVGKEGVRAFGLQPIQMRPWQMGPADVTHGEAVLGRLLPDQSDPHWETIPFRDEKIANTYWEIAPAALLAARPEPVWQRPIVGEGAAAVFDGASFAALAALADGRRSSRGGNGLDV